MKCPVCHSPKSSLFKVVNNYDILQCSKCRLLYTKATKNDNAKANQATYTSVYLKNYEVMLSKYESRYKKIHSLISKYKTSGTLLDVGCGSGYFLNYIKRYHQWKPIGVEVNKKLRLFASKRLGLTVLNGSMEKIPAKNNSIDVLTCFDVLEHSQDLGKNIDEFYRVIKKNGLLVIQAPNYSSLMTHLTGTNWDWWSPPDHLLHFSPAYLRDYLQGNGFEVLSVSTYEETIDFMQNVRGTLAKDNLSKILFLISKPLLFLVERVSWVMNKGGLLIIIAQPK